MTRNCPRCSKTMALLTKSNIELDACPDCKGIWFDKDELDKITGSPNSFEGMIFTARSLGRDIPCPSCGRKMNYYTVEGVTVDYCQDCAGIWLDSGELSAIGEVLEHIKSQKPSPSYEIQEDKAKGLFSKVKTLFKS